MMPTRVLSVDLEPRPEPPFQGPRWLPPDVHITRVKVLAEPLPTSAEGYTHLILSGSSWSICDDHPEVEPAEALIRDAVRRAVPVLGICYGHQLIVRALLGRAHVRRSPTPEVGWLPVRVHRDPLGLFSPLPSPFHTYVGHFDEVVDLPPDWPVLASTGHCAVQAFAAPHSRVVGLQFHPEMDVATATACLSAEVGALADRGFDVPRIVSAARDDGAGRVIFPRFLDLTWP